MSSSTLTVSANRLRRALSAAVSWSPHNAAVATGPADLDLPLAHIAAGAARDAAADRAVRRESAPRPAEVSASAKPVSRAHRGTARRGTRAVRR
ncbi:hypothetical protein ACIOC1_28285 [Streptomyces sp. NPDC088197]|uniref:hypothetical protein n=1 Tax=unclassified Streptomyces TaxID=2593676 RepID=UPI0033A37C2E